MDNAIDTSTAALAVTVKPAVNEYVAIAAGVTLVVAAGAAVIYKLRKRKMAQEAALIIESPIDPQ